jgi:hypothetical protein
MVYYPSKGSEGPRVRLVMFAMVRYAEDLHLHLQLAGLPASGSEWECLETDQTYLYRRCARQKAKRRDLDRLIIRNRRVEGGPDPGCRKA